MLAFVGKLRPYLHGWQVPIMLAFIFGWIVGGGHLLRLAVRRYLVRRPTLGKCVLTSFLAGMAGAVAAGVTFGLFWTIGSTSDVELTIVGLVAAAVMLLGCGYLVIYAGFEISAPAAVRVAAPPMLAIIILGGGLGVAAGLPAYHIQQSKLKRGQSCQRLYRVYDALKRYAGSAAPSLQELLDRKLISPDFLRSPGAPGKKIGYFYYPRRTIGHQHETSKILACDFGDNFPGKGRAVLLIDGRCSWFTEEDFQELLAKPENRLFAKELAAAEGPPPPE